MPAKSAAQQKAVGAALSAKRGKTSVSKLRGASKSMYKSMSERQLGKPAHAAKSRPSTRKSPARKSGSRKKSR